MNILLLGASSMIGREVEKQLIKLLNMDDNLLYCPSHKDLDVLKFKKLKKFIKKEKIGHIVTLAGLNGGIQYNLSNPHDIFSTNLKMCSNIMGAAHENNVEKLVYVMPTCAFPDVPIFSRELIRGSVPHSSVQCHGLSRRNYYYYACQLHKQYQREYIGVALNSVFGPHDKFGANGKVLGSLIRKFINAKLNGDKTVELNGSGAPMRGFIYVSDAAAAIVFSLFNYSNSLELFAVDSHEISIKNLANMIANTVGYRGQIKFNGGVDGQMRKQLLGDSAFPLQVSLEEGIRNTVDWYYKTLGESR